MERMNTQTDNVQIMCDTWTLTHKPCSDHPGSQSTNWARTARTGQWPPLLFFALIFAPTSNSGPASESQTWSPATRMAQPEGALLQSPHTNTSCVPTCLPVSHCVADPSDLVSLSEQPPSGRDGLRWFPHHQVVILSSSLVTSQPGDRHLFIIISRLWHPRPRSSRLSTWKNLVHGSWTAVFSQHAHVVKGTRELSGTSSMRVLVQFMWAPPTWPDHLSKSRTSQYHHSAY